MKLTTPLRGADWLLIRRLRPASPVLARSLQQLSEQANDAKIWLAAAGVLAVTGRQGRRSALEGLLAVGTTSALVNGVLKRLARRSRPAGLLAIGLSPTGRAPKTSSFPSGHAATAVAFTTAASLSWPVLAAPLGAIALAVSWSRVISVRHFPSDVAVGLAVGTVCGVGVHVAMARILGPASPRPATVDAPSAERQGVTDSA